jgi:hypothetical protein
LDVTWDARFVAVEARFASFTSNFPSSLMPVGKAQASLTRLRLGQAVVVPLVACANGSAAPRDSRSFPLFH